ncbi:hypothetical protein [Oceanihabitans sediminis]|uniref:hypothetical protein n=1 Tax=Oceanihabitans sediminis TaxID=1812012 RepID=UPI00299D9425|nr:hypothetical protein [Oceanihabitans sediminis]MDX1279238.1 hypothetical protein [Oceanihabitans sediminis]
MNLEEGDKFLYRPKNVMYVVEKIQEEYHDGCLCDNCSTIQVRRNDGFLTHMSFVDVDMGENNGDIILQNSITDWKRRLEI